MAWETCEWCEKYDSENCFCRALHMGVADIRQAEECPDFAGTERFLEELEGARADEAGWPENQRYTEYYYGYF